ncbi:MAG: TIGR04100 family radical SAM protein, partial [Bacilli bacterium]
EYNYKNSKGERQMTIFYEAYDNLYINITNRCPCSCDFCVRNEADGVGEGNVLWLEHEPTFEEIKADFKKFDMNKYGEIIFCGFGEPLERIDILIETAKFLRENTNKTIRINTNGLSDLINEKPTAHMLEGIVDVVSISLNASNKITYEQICHPSFGQKSFDAMLDFAKDCKKYVPKVVLSVVDTIGKDEIEKCNNIAKNIGVEFRVREFI